MIYHYGIRLITFADDGFGNCLHLSCLASSAAFYFLGHE